MPQAERALPEAYQRTRPGAFRGHVWRPPLYFGVLLYQVLLVAAYELLVRQPLAFTASAGPSSRLPIVAGLVALALGFVLTRGDRTAASAGFAPTLLVTASVTALSASIDFWSFAYAQHWISLVVTTTAGALLGRTARQGGAALGAWWHELSLLSRLLNPFALLAMLTCLGVAVSLGPLLGLLRSAYVLGSLLLVLTLWFPRLHHYLEGTWVPGSLHVGRAAMLCLLLLGAAMLVSERWISREQLRYFQNPIVFTARSEESEIVVTRGPSGLELFHNRSLRWADIDSYRYYEALVHPAFGLRPEARRVLVLGGADGFAEQEVLRHRTVDVLDVVSDDLTLGLLAQRTEWLRRRTGRALESPKTQLIEQEPIVWLGQKAAKYDLVIVDLPDPMSPRFGKYFTRYFFGLVQSHLASEGIAAIQASPLFKAPRTFAAVTSSVRAAGLFTASYHVALPSIGEWGFLLASNRNLETPIFFDVEGTRFLSAETLAQLFQVPKDRSRAEPEPPSTLYDQTVVTLFQREIQMGSGQP